MPLPTNKPFGYAAADLGLGTGLGGLLSDQVAGETEEQRKKRMLEMQQRQAMGPGNSPSVMSLFGGGLGAGVR